MEKKSYDFAGWATKNNIRCSDGRTIRKGAFSECNGKTVPLVWNHDHNAADNVLGHMLLEERDEGVYGYGYFNDTPQGANAKKLVTNGDIVSLSIYANKLKQNGGDVVHGFIREVSLVLAGANPGAFIDTVIAHSDSQEEEAVIYHEDQTFDMYHEEPAANSKEAEIQHKDEMEDKNMPDNKEKTVKEIFDTLTEEQKTVVYALIGAALEEKKNPEDEEDMKHNAFDTEEVGGAFLSHSDMAEICANAKRIGSFKDAFNEFIENHEELAHSITNVGNLFPEAQLVSKTPSVVDRDQTWVGKVMKGVKHTPFSRVKSTYANITADEARAKGYVKGNQKVEEVIVAAKRSTDPTTVYKLQKIDRDDYLDITDFDVVAWLKLEMRGKLDEELARAILIGDGRLTSSNDKIDPLKIRPILGDNSVYTVAKSMVRGNAEDDYAFAKRFIKEAIRARKEYKGSGNPTLFCTEDLLTDMLLIEDVNGRVIYDTIEKLRTALRVTDIVTVPVMENQTRTSGTDTYKLMGILVNLSDYNVGSDKGGAVSMFEDFDINFNKMEYLIETRCSGALVTPYSAITFEEKITGEASE